MYCVYVYMCIKIYILYFRICITSYVTVTMVTFYHEPGRNVKIAFRPSFPSMVRVHEPRTVAGKRDRSEEGRNGRCNRARVALSVESVETCKRGRRRLFSRMDATNALAFSRDYVITPAYTAGAVCFQELSP